MIVHSTLKREGINIKDKRVDALIATLMPCQCSWWAIHRDDYYCDKIDGCGVRCGGELSKCELEDDKKGDK